MPSKLYPFFSVIIFAILYLFTAAISLIIIVFVYLKIRPAIRFLSGIWARGIFLLMGKNIQVTGLENIQKNKKYLIVANHASLFDIVAIMSVFPRISWFGHERLLKVPVFGKILLMTDYVPFRREGIQSTRQMIAKLKDKSREHTVAIFPEGTRTTDGKIHDFYRGFIVLFRASDMEILPLTLNGFFQLKPKTRSTIDFGARLSIHIHKPLALTEVEKNSDSVISTIIKSKIQSQYLG